MLKTFKSHIDSSFEFLKSAKLLIAFSGGLDSVVLANLCHQINLDFALAHCNFNLRGKESDADEDFVEHFAEALKLEVFIENFETESYAKKNKLSLQMAARELRYEWFDALTERLGFDFVLTAHHADDNLETFLINLSRGTGLDGLTGIPKIKDKIVRPLLPFSREEVQNYAISNSLNWREDSSNVSTKYLRNKLRLEVIPKLKELNPQFLLNFHKTQGFLRGSKDIIEDRVDDLSKTIISDISDDGICFNIKNILKLSNPKAYLYEFLKDFGFTEFNDVVDLLEAQSGKQLFSRSYRLIKDRNVLILTYHPLQEETSVTIQESDKEIKISLGVITLNEVDAFEKSDETTIYVDKDLLNFPLTVRKWEKGDYFYPFGMKGKKKLSKYFKDEKLSLVAKENSRLLCSKNEVLWVIGKRQDNRFKVTNNTKHILKLTIRE